MEKNQKKEGLKQNKTAGNNLPRGNNLLKIVWEESWTYIKTVVDIVRQPILILDKNFRVMAANEVFYQTFQVKPEDTVGKIVYELGNGQWNIPALRELLEDILPKKTFFKGFEVVHEFPVVGRKIIILNARQIHSKFVKKEDIPLEPFPPIILLAMEDVTEIMSVAEKLADHTNKFEAKMADRTQLMEEQISILEKEISDLKKKP